jgi:hypothetical protein
LDLGISLEPSAEKDSLVTIVPGDLAVLIGTYPIQLSPIDWRSRDERNWDPHLRFATNDVAVVVAIEPELGHVAENLNFIATLLTSNGKLGCIYTWVLTKVK